MMSDVFASFADRIVLLQEAEGFRNLASHRLQRMRSQRSSVQIEQVEEIVNRAIDELQRAVHVTFTQRKVRVKEHATIEFSVRDPKGDSRLSQIAEAMLFAIGVDDGERASFDKTRQEMAEEKHFGRPVAVRGGELLRSVARRGTLADREKLE